MPQFLVIAYDGTDEQALARRMAARAATSPMRSRSSKAASHPTSCSPGSRRSSASSGVAPAGAGDRGCSISISWPGAEARYARVGDELFGGILSYSSDTRLSAMQLNFNEPTSDEMG